jgi:hypothetical protein
MKTVFKVLAMMLITSLSVSAQNKQILSKVLKANEKTELTLDLRNAYVQFETSIDTNIYIDYAIDFNNYPVDEIEEILRGLSINVEQKDNSYLIKIGSKHSMSSKVYTLDTEFGVTMDNGFTTTETNKRKFRTTKTALISTINMEEKVADVMLRTLKKYNKDGTTELIDLKKAKSYSVKFIIKIPQQIRLNLKLKKSEIRFKEDLVNQINCTADNSTIRSKSISNSLNSFQMDGGVFKGTYLSGGRYTFKDLNKIMIGSLDHVVLDSEFSDFSIGEIGGSVEVNDFNSQFWLYGFNSKMGEFIMNTEYSKINLYFPADKSNFLLLTYGYGTVHYMDNVKTIIRPSRSKISSKMMIIGDESTATNIAKINTINGIVRLGEDFIDIEN